MNRNEATKFLRQLLDNNGLSTWRISLATDVYKPYLGLCNYQHKTIILNAHHIDTHPTPEVLNTIRHEVAHAIVGPNHGHDDIWKIEARKQGCDNTLPCATYSLDPSAIDAIRSGAMLDITFEEEVQVIRTPKYTVHRLQDKCPTCGKVAKIKEIKEVTGYIVKFFECGHMEMTVSSSKSPFQKLIFDGDSKCKHKFGTGKNRAECELCGAHKLFDFQVEGCRALERANGRLAILDEQGLGKTIQPLAYLKYNLDAFPYLWVTKSKIKYPHVREIVRILGDSYMPQLIETSKQKMFTTGKLKGYMISYDLFRRLDLSMIEEAQIKTIVLDECQAIKNPDSSRTQAIREVVKNIPKVIPTSGTFWKNRGSEAFVMLNMLDPKMFWSFADFKRRHVKYITDPITGKEKEAGFKNPEKFREMISHIAIRRTRSEVLPDLPVANRVKLICEVPEHARNVYKEEENKVKAIMKDAAIDGTEHTFAIQSALQESIMKMRQIVGLAKVPTIVDYLQEFLEDTDKEQIVCGVAHIKVGDLVYEQMSTWCQENDELPPVRIAGGMSAVESNQIQNQFNNGKSRLLVASTLAAGEGLNLQHRCNKMLIAERQWNAANEEQLEDRLIRIGQEADGVDIIYALADKTVDTTLDKLVEMKRRAFRESMDKSGYVNAWSEQNIFKEMVNAIVKGE